MGKAFKSIRKIIAILLVVLAVALLAIAGMQACGLDLVGADGILTNWLSDVSGFGFLQNLTATGVFGLGLLALAVAFIVDSDTAGKAVSKVGGAVKDFATSATGAITGVVSGILGALLGSPIGWLALGIGGIWLYRWLFSDDAVSSDGSVQVAKIQHDTRLAELRHEEKMKEASDQPSGYLPPVTLGATQ